jgi:predicted esterase
VVVCPSFGYGNWEHPHSWFTVQRAVRYATEHFAEIDPRRVYLAGVSQGGAGVGRAAVALPEVFAGLVFLSATLEPAVLDDEGFAGKRVLVIHGDADRHVNLASVEKGVAVLRSAGADVTFTRDPAGTHFLLFAQAQEVFRQVGEWMGEGAEVKPSSLPPANPARG